MRWWLGVMVLVVACKHATSTRLDASLPEQLDEVLEATPRQVLTEAAAELDPSLRARALELVLRNDWGPEWDARALGDPSGWVQRAAVEALAARGTADTRQRLLAFITDSTREPMARAIAALRLTGPDARDAIGRAWRAEPASWRRSSMALASVVHGDDEALEVLTSIIGRGQLPLELELFFAIGQSAEPALVEPLQRAQRTVEPELELPVAAARWMLGDGSAEEPFRKAVVGADVERRLEALDYLVRLDRGQTRGLILKARNQGPELVRWYADLALAAAAGNDSGLFEKAAAHPDREVRELAVHFASEVATSAEPNRRLSRVARKVLIGGLADDHSRVRLEALQGVRTHRLVEAAPAVQALLSDENRMVRLEASGTALLLE